MRCDSCGEREAEVHVTQIVDDELTTRHLCEACAEAQGVSGVAEPSSGEGPLADFLAEMGKGSSTQVLPEASEACPYCGTSPDDFRRTGRLGCSQCYAHFEDQLRGLLRRIHGSTQHVGKLYLAQGVEEEDPETRLKTLKRRLKRAVEVEDFETAAVLRDQIQDLEPVE